MHAVEPDVMGDAQETSRNSGDVFTNLYPALVQCFFIILLGYGSGRLGIFPPVMAKGLGKFLSHIILPAFLFKAMVALNFDDVNWKVLAALLLAKGIVFFLVSVLGFVSSRPMNIGRAGIYAIFTTQSNDFAFGYPILKALYQDCHPEYLKYLYLVAPVSLVCLNPIGFFMMEYQREQTTDTTAAVSKFRCVVVTLKGVLSNPIVFMTFLGVIANFILRHASTGVPLVIDNILTVLSNAFSATALFYLGLKNVAVGGEKRMSDKLQTLMIPLVLVAIKTLLLPVVAFEMVSSLHVASNSTETPHWGAFGFLYGTIPTAPAVLIYASRFSIEVETITTGLVLCTFLSAPLMFLAAKMMTLHYSMQHKMEYTNIIRQTFRTTSYVNLVATIVMLVLFILGRKYLRKCPHNYTLCLLLCQIFTSVGLIISQVEGLTENLHILVFVLFFFGMYGSRCWAAMVALALYFLRCQGYAELVRNRNAIHMFGWGAPIFCTGIALCTSKMAGKGGKGSPKSFITEVTEQESIGGISLTLLLLCVAVAVFCLLSVQRCDKYCRCKTGHKIMKSHSNVVDPEIEKSLIQNRCNRCKELFDERGEPLPCQGSMPDTISDIENLGKSCMLRCSNETPEYGSIEEREAVQHKRSSLVGLDRFEFELTIKEYYSGDKHQLTRHVVLLVLLIMSMVLDIAMVFWRMMDSSEENGIYLEMNLLGGVLNYSQGFIVFFIFGFEKQFIFWPFMRRWRKLRYGVEKIKLVEERDVDVSVIHLCEQFNRYHKQRCQQNIVSDKRYNFRTYKSVFLGSDLVDWLLEIGLAVDRHSAVSYGRTLLDGRVIRHIHEEHHFADLPYLYQFCQQ